MDDWDTAQTVTVKAGQDADGANDTVTLTHTASGGDYVSITKDLPVSITDDDDPQVTVMFVAGAYTVLEGEMQLVTVTLSTDPKRMVIIPLTATPHGGATSDDYTVPTTVTFNTGEMSKSFTFMATQDDMDENCECVLLAFGALPSGVSKGPTPTATVSIADIATTPEGTPTVPRRPPV